MSNTPAWMTLPSGTETILSWQDHVLSVDGVSLEHIAQTHSTPTFVYSERAIQDAYRESDQALAGVQHHIAYAVKANDNLGILKRFCALGASADIVSGGELDRAIKAGFSPDRIVFSGVGKSDIEIHHALRAGIQAIHVESAPELDAIEAIAQAMGKVAPLGLRVNPNVDPITHPYISTGLHQSKFGLELDVARTLVTRILQSPHLKLVTIACHIGSQLGSSKPLAEAVDIVTRFALECQGRGAPIQTVDAGGGWPIHYGNEQAPVPSRTECGQAVVRAFTEAGGKAQGWHLNTELGRSLIGAAGLLLTRVVFIKEQAGKRFVIVDTAMNDLMRPALYKAYHHIVPVNIGNLSAAPIEAADIVGPVCETGDFLALKRDFPAVKRGDLIAVLCAGAYAASMASSYNARPRPAEVLISNNRMVPLRTRGTVADLWQQEVTETGELLST